MRILSEEENSFFFPFDRFLGPSCCKDYFLEKVLGMQLLYEVPEESQFSDSVWWLYKPTR